MNYPSIVNSVLVLIDMQEKLLKAMPDVEPVLNKQKIILQAAVHMNLDMIATEQYPQGLGSTIAEIKTLLPSGIAIIEKKTFSCFGAPAFASAISAKTRSSIAIMGVESHVCVLQTAIDALNRNYQVFILEDAVTSRSQLDKNIALRLLRDQGAVITSVESYLFMLMQTSAHPTFRDISKLLR